ncbi:Restriction endonuclease type II-like [Micractinium conductrix]|uniref:Restriction endonuclease type II-like n=1 Tax=Micractinium conductrix TaxID=554055 RepID=A0A2P6VH72_9CHLO|nr:Restriction endonuclease type II-like [Micractinium conductrix]|eukprot:PSC73441.1 Restriction endonuclease type II-like [Micractinium conductrix]
MRLQQQEPMFGRFPNVHFRAPTMEELRQQPTFEALPPAAAVALAGTASARYVRQDDALWGELHAGVLTTGLVRSALGLYEKGAVKKGTGGGWGVSEEAKLRKARTLGSLGLLSICCSWGSAQEAASLVQVAAAFPGSQLAEVGLCRLQEALLPPAWGEEHLPLWALSKGRQAAHVKQFAVADRGPRMVVPPEWVPQLQLHMLCADTPSGLLISRSATKGARIFRMRRDDELLRCMLQVISRLWVEHVLAGRPPPPDAFANWHVHHDMLRRIGESARGAELVAVLEEGQHLPPGDPRFFLD